MYICVCVCARVYNNWIKGRKEGRKGDSKGKKTSSCSVLISHASSPKVGNEGSEKNEERKEGRGGSEGSEGSDVKEGRK